MYFGADSGTRDANGNPLIELWKTDGTVVGTARVTTKVRNPSGLVAFGGLVYFVGVDSATSVSGIWRTNGSDSGTIPLSQAGVLDRTLQVRLLDAEGDGSLTALDSTASASTLVTNLLLTTGGRFRWITNAVRAALSAGRTRITLRVSLDSPNPSNPLQIFSSTDGTHQTGLRVSALGTSGVVADLFDAGGNLLVSGKTIMDLGTLPAGTYFARIYRPGDGPKPRFHAERAASNPAFIPDAPTAIPSTAGTAIF